MFRKILLALALLVAAVLIIGAFQPATYRVTRSVVIVAPAPAIFPDVNDLHRWRDWSPYEKVDPAMQRAFEGPASGVGAVYSWAGNNDVGSGKMTIVESRASELIRIKLEFFKPMAGQGEAVFTFVPEAGATRVTWEMRGDKNYLSKVICMFMNMDKMIGGQFEEGLAALKAQAEKNKK